jgi:hypothetical protein
MRLPCYHVVVETPDGNLSKGMRQLNGVYTQDCNRRHGLVGHLFQEQDGVRSQNRTGSGLTNRTGSGLTCNTFPGLGSIGRDALP